MSKRNITMFLDYGKKDIPVDEEDRRNVTDMVEQLVETRIIPDVVTYETNRRAETLARHAHAEFCKAARALGDVREPTLSTVYNEAVNTRLYVSSLLIPESFASDSPYAISKARGVDLSDAPVQTWVEREEEDRDWDKFYRGTVHLDKVIRPRRPKPSP